jgi:NAD-dependent deacetylase
MKIFVLTGAGISAESGVATFRDAGGVWAQYDYRDVATPQGFARNPALVHEFYNGRRAALPTVFPNPAHVALAKLERELETRGGTLYLCTQNVDDLHERGGSKRVVHMHGALNSTRCDACGDTRPDTEPRSTSDVCGACGREGRLRPDVVWFGEMPMFMDEIDTELRAADLFVSIGTSGSVYPAAGFVEEARRLRIRTCEINLERSENAWAFDEGRYGPAGTEVPAWVDTILAA